MILSPTLLSPNMIMKITIYQTESYKDMKNAMKPPIQESTHKNNEKKKDRASMVPAFTRKRNKEFKESKTKRGFS